MDPYIEAFGPWRDFHHRFNVYMCDALQPLVRPKYRVRVEERVLFGSGERWGYPDASIVRESAEAYATAAIAAGEYDPPVVIQAPPPPEAPHQVFLQIILPGPEAKVVTVIEMLSPSNKTLGAARRKYTLKQAEIMLSNVNLVEIDLLLEGAHVAAVPKKELANLDAFDYLVSVNRPADRDQFELYPTLLSQRLPRIAAPLLPDDEDVALNLQAVFNQTYDNGAYADDIDYTQSLPLSISDEQTARIDSLLKSSTQSEVAV